MTEQNKELFIEFVNFCESQPEDKVIDHTYWSTCAVGEFAKHKGIHIRDGYLASDFINQEECYFIESLFGVSYEDIDEEGGGSRRTKQ